jgi:hypothetical protein
LEKNNFMKKFFKFKTWKIVLFVFLIPILISFNLAFLCFRNENNIARAGTGENVSGFAWSENIGWISFNSTDCDQSAGNYTGTPAGCPSGTQVFDYGVNIDTATGNFSGFAWSEYAGWISFNRSDAGNPPSQPYQSGTYIARHNSGNGEVDGWAKVLILGDDGWIKLRKFSSDGGPSYGLSINSGNFSGWAWNGNAVAGTGIGWISFNCADTGAGGCTGHDYRVRLGGGVPDAPTIGIIEDLSCPANDPMPVRVNWTDNSNNETGFEVEKSEDQIIWTSHCSLISTPAESSETGVSRNCSGWIADGTDNTLYYFRVRSNGSGGNSSWSTSGSYTRGHCKPSISATDNCGSILVEWLYNGSGNYDLYRGVDGVVPEVFVPNITNLTKFYNDIDISSASTYEYYVKSLNDNQESNHVSKKPCSGFTLPRWKEVKP